MPQYGDIPGLSCPGEFYVEFLVLTGFSGYSGFTFNANMPYVNTFYLSIDTDDPVLCKIYSVATLVPLDRQVDNIIYLSIKRFQFDPVSSYT